PADRAARCPPAYVSHPEPARRGDRRGDGIAPPCWRASFGTDLPFFLRALELVRACRRCSLRHGGEGAACARPQPWPCFMEGGLCRKPTDASHLRTRPRT